MRKVGDILREMLKNGYKPGDYIIIEKKHEKSRDRHRKGTRSMD